MKGKRNWKELQERLIENYILKRGIKDKRIIESMRKVPRHLFIPDGERNIEMAYEDVPLPIGYGQTISQPYMVAYMLLELELTKESKVLEIGTGSGYNAALLGLLAKEVYTVETIPELSKRAEKTIKSLGIKNIRFFVGDGSLGLPEFAPYDRIIVTCSAPHIPDPLLEQLSKDGIMIIPVNEGYYDMLKKVLKHKDGKIEVIDLTPCAFVPMRGKYGF